MLSGIRDKSKFWNLPGWCLTLLLILLGAVLRLAYLGVVPGGMFQDEAIVAWNAYALLKEGIDSAGHAWPVYMADWGDGHSALYVWLSIPMIAINGGHISAFFCRLPQAIVAILTLACCYDLMKRLFNRKLALWTRFFLAICPWHIMIARWGLDVDLAPGFLIFSLYFFIRGMDNRKFLLLSALFYGLCLHTYAVIWPIIPIMLLLQIIYCLCHRKLSIDKWSMLATVILFLMALPMLLFVAVNSGLIPEICLPFMTIPEMGGYRGSEIALTFSGMYQNFKTACALFLFQNTGAPYDFLLPWGLYYDIGRVFIVIGVICLVWKVLKALVKKEFVAEYFIFVQLVGGGITCLLVTAKLHQINAVFLPLVLCEAYGVYAVLGFIKTKKESLETAFTVIIVAVYLICLVLFQKDYYTDYKELVSAYFAEGVEDCVRYAKEQCAEKNIDTITVEKGAQWPRLLMYTETLPSVYLSSVVYDEYPAPARFDTNEGLHINTRINYDNISNESIYIIYYTDTEKFEQDFDLTVFHDYWYVAVPK